MASTSSSSISNTRQMLMKNKLPTSNFTMTLGVRFQKTKVKSTKERSSSYSTILAVEVSAKTVALIACHKDGNA